MTRNYRLDTNFVVAVLNEEPATFPFIAEAEQFFVSAVVAGELHFGALNSVRRQSNLTRLHGFLQQVVIGPVDQAIAEVYAEVSLELRSKGRPIPENDRWIAATAIAFDLPLVSQDRHFNAIQDLRRRDWSDPNRAI